MACVLACGAARAQAQDHVEVMGQAIGLVTHVDPAPLGGTDTRAALVQPVLMAHARLWGGRLRLNATANFEGLTIPDGELQPGGWGEGFVDRRHPHTYAHELMAALVQPVADGRVSLAAGKGFVAFGTDDPMVRPIVRYPVNHHLAQVLERAVVIAGAQWRWVAIEGTAFNGDEPERPGQWPAIRRFGDSFAGRLTLTPVRGLELQGSHAKVHSPEHRPGAGTDQYKWSASGRYEGRVAGARVYGLAEWARTSEAGGFFLFHSALAEGSVTAGVHRVAYRFERTERPEEGRLLDPWRAARPHLDNSILGISRFTLHTLNYTWLGAPAPRRMRLEPFAELTVGHSRSVGDGLFDVAVFYGKTSVLALTAGLRVGLGGPMWRMGRYGVGQADGAMHSHGEPI